MTQAAKVRSRPGKPPPLYHPRAVHARISSGCNLACNFCERELLGPGRPKKPGIIVFQDARPPLDLSKDMSLAVWELICEKLMPHTPNMELGGLGEPTMAAIFPRACSDIRKAGKNLFFFSNGHALGSKKVIDAVKDIPLRVSVSIDAGTPEGYQRVRGADLGRLIKSVKSFKDQVPGAVLCSQFTATTDNISELPAFTRLCAELGIGRFDEGGEIVVVGAQHHVTDRAEKSVRFALDVTQRAVDESVAIAQKERLWLISRLPQFSDANPNAWADGSDPSFIRRYTDRLLGEIICPILPLFVPLGAPRRKRNAPPIVYAPQQMYVDHTGEVWTCLARHRIGDVQTGTWESLVDANPWYQAHLRFYAGHDQETPEICRKCPNLA